MKLTAVLFTTFIFLGSICAQIKPVINGFTGIAIDTLFRDKIAIRAILIDKNKVYYAANENRFGSINFITKNKFERKIINDSLKIEFRSIAQTSSSIFILTVGNPAILYKFSKTSNHKKPWDYFLGIQSFYH